MATRSYDSPLLLFWRGIRDLWYYDGWVSFVRVGISSPILRRWPGRFLASPADVIQVGGAARGVRSGPSSTFLAGLHSPLGGLPLTASAGPPSSSPRSSAHGHCIWPPSDSLCRIWNRQGSQPTQFRCWNKDVSRDCLRDLTKLAFTRETRQWLRKDKEKHQVIAGAEDPFRFLRHSNNTTTP